MPINSHRENQAQNHVENQVAIWKPPNIGMNLLSKIESLHNELFINLANII